MEVFARTDEWDDDVADGVSEDLVIEGRFEDLPNLVSLLSEEAFVFPIEMWVFYDAVNDGFDFLVLDKPKAAIVKFFLSMIFS